MSRRFRCVSRAIIAKGKPQTLRDFSIKLNSVITLEMTWGETSHTQVYMKEETSKESSCFALTSIELLAAAFIIRLVSKRENLFVQNARQSSTPPSAHVLALL